LAGGCAAYALASRGAQVTIIESGSGLCTKASGNRHGIITPYITSRPSPLQTVYSTGFEYTLNLLQGVLGHSISDKHLFDRCGALHLPATSRLEQLLNDASACIGPTDIQRVSSSSATELAGIPINSNAFLIPDAGFVNPADLIYSLIALQSDSITTRITSRAIEVIPSSSHWRVRLSDGSYCEASIVILCSAFESSQLEVSSWLPLEPIRGQTIAVEESPISSQLRMVLCFGGYLVPARKGIHLMGAHYRHHDNEEKAKDEDSADILRVSSHWLPNIPFTQSQIREARVCFRTSTLDRLPYIGALPDFRTMECRAAEFQPGTDLIAKVPNQSLKGLYVSVGHGSRGLLSCPMGGEILARNICDEPLGELEAASRVCCPSRLPHRILRAARER